MLSGGGTLGGCERRVCFDLVDARVCSVLRQEIKMKVRRELVMIDFLPTVILHIFLQDRSS